MIVIPVVLFMMVTVTIGKHHDVPLFEVLSYHYNATASLNAPSWVENLLGKQAMFTSNQQRKITPMTYCSMEILGMVSADAPRRGNAKLYIDGARTGDNSWSCFYRTIKVTSSFPSTHRSSHSSFHQHSNPTSHRPLNPPSNLIFTSSTHLFTCLDRKIGVEENMMPCPSLCIVLNNNLHHVFLSNQCHPMSQHHQYLLLSIISRPIHLEDVHQNVSQY